MNHLFGLFCELWKDCWYLKGWAQKSNPSSESHDDNCRCRPHAKNRLSPEATDLTSLKGQVGTHRLDKPSMPPQRCREPPFTKRYIFPNQIHAVLAV